MPKRGIVPLENTVLVILNGGSDWQVDILCAALNQLGEKDIVPLTGCLISVNK